jgi:multiple sugar transport system permease protein
MNANALKASTKETFWAYTFLAPNLLGFLLFTFLPVVASLLLSFIKWDIITWPPKWIGLDNFIKLLGFSKVAGIWQANDPLFWKYLGNTVFLMLIIPFSMFGSLLAAVALNQKIKGIVFFRTIYFLPAVCSGVAIAILWKWMYNPDFGIINLMISRVGDFLHIPLHGPNWLSSTTWAKPALMFMTFWLTLGGYNMILYLAALQGIPRELYEVAEIDGASAWHKFWAITIPLISPTTFFIAIMSVIGGFQGGFMAAYIMTGGGPAGSTTTLEYYIFNNLYVFQHSGYAACIAWVLFIIIFFITILTWRFGGKLVHYH